MLVPQEKKNKALALLHEAVSRNNHQVKFIQKLAGTLNFLHRAIVPGRAFTRGLYRKLKLTNGKGQQLKQHHHVTVGTEFKLDCKVWIQFLSSENLKICRPFLDAEAPEGQVLNFASDAAKSEILGIGAVFNDNWLYMAWGKAFIKNMDPSIEFLELLALTAAVVTWSRDHRLLRNNRVVVFCDNQAVIQVVNNYTSSCPQCKNRFASWPCVASNII